MTNRSGIVRRLNVVVALVLSLTVSFTQAAQAGVCDATWRAQPTVGLPNAATFEDVAVTGTGEVWAVGRTGTRGLLAHHVGSTWTSSRFAVSGRTVRIRSVDAVPGAAWAVGTITEETTQDSSSFVLVNTGQGWRRQSLPNAVADAALRSVAVRSARDVWIGGSLGTWSEQINPVALHWNGTRLSVMRVPFRGQAFSVEAPREGGALLAGLGQTLQTDYGPQVWRWNGSTWRRDAMPEPPFGEEPFFPSVDSTGGRAWSVGFSIGGCCSAFPFAYRWTGSRWVETVLPPTNAQVWDVLVSAVDRHAVIVGLDVCAEQFGCSGYDARALVLEWTGTRWVERNVAGIAAARDTGLSAVDGNGRGERWAVGDRDGGPLLLRQCASTT
jgi:hypothetical protein